MTEKGISPHFEEGNRSCIFLHLRSHDKLDKKMNGPLQAYGNTIFYLNSKIKIKSDSFWDAIKLVVVKIVTKEQVTATGLESTTTLFAN